MGTKSVYIRVSDRETCPRGREGLDTYSGVAISARDISVGAVIEVYPRSEMFISG